MKYTLTLLMLICSFHSMAEESAHSTDMKKFVCDFTRLIDGEHTLLTSPFHAKKITLVAKDAETAVGLFQVLKSKEISKLSGNTRDLTEMAGTLSGVGCKEIIE